MTPAARILIADDHALIRLGLKNCLADATDFTVVGEAGDGEELLAFLAAREADLLILDLQMPKGSGYELLPALKQSYPALKIIVLTAYKTFDAVCRVMAQGVEGFIVKEDSEHILVRAVREVLAGRVYISPCCSQVFNTEPVHASQTDGGAPLKKMTVRERQVLIHLVMGKTSKDIADILGISFRTVDQHRASLLVKFGAKNTAELLGMVFRDGLLS
ncbi:MAG: response regulator transcription factor [Desulfobulbaceae bacterium]|jgi:DNA-binding NarL/FixJ family response regulator|nr:response regulator transcription factor [Desulfobulbaceae bacterium]